MKKREELLKKAYQKVIEVGLGNRSIDDLSSFIEQNVMGYGTAIDEKILSMADFIDLVQLQRKQAVNFDDFYFTSNPVLTRLTDNDNTGIVVDEIELVTKIGNDSNKLDLRMTAVFEFKEESWKLLHWHSSKPEHVSDGQDPWHVDEWKKKTEKLERMVDEKTAELVKKNEELEVEASLERVRAVAMGMNKSDDLLSISEVSFKEFKKLGFDNLRSAIIHIPNDEQKYFMDYDFSEFAGGNITKIEYGLHPIVDEYLEKIRSAQDAYFEVVIKEDQLQGWKDFRKISGQHDDPLLEKATALYYYLFSIGIGDIGISAFEAINNSQIKILKRFRNVFDLAYKRYKDIALAEGQAREAEIQLAMERVRARTMAMQKSDELKNTALLLFQQVRELEIPAWGCGFNIWDDDKKAVTSWNSSEGQIEPPVKIPSNADVFLRFYEAAQMGESLYVEEMGGEALEAHYKYMGTLPGVSDIINQFSAAGIELPTNQIFHIAYFSHGYLMFITYEAVPNAQDIFKRYAKVFEQTYTRFLDLQKAEAQAREAEIEAALERVRSRSLAMQKSEDLSKVASVTFEQMKKLGGDLFAFGIVLCDKHENMVEQWHSLGNEGMMPPFLVPIDLDYIHQYRYDQWKSGAELFSIEIPEDYITRHFELMFELPSVDAAMNEVAAKDIQVKIPDWEIDYGASFRHGYLLVSSLKPFKENHIFPRFAKVFEQAYIRFLDLKKAEAQAREALIEAALERVRSRSMAMYSSDELREVVAVFYEQLQPLGLAIRGCEIIICNEKDKTLNYWWSDESNAVYPQCYTAPADGHPVLKKQWNAWKDKVPLLITPLEGKRKRDFDDYLFEQTDFKSIPDSVKDAVYNDPSIVFSHVIMKNGMIGAVDVVQIDDEGLDILKRFAQVFDQTYTRFLDLQKAEAQARESEIELALERVRARTMAMQHSDELSEASFLLDSQVRALGIKTRGCAFNIYGENESTEWFSSEMGTLPVYKTPRENIFLRYFKEGQKGVPIYIESFEGPACAAHYDYLCTLPIMGEALIKFKEEGGSFPTTQIDHVTYFKYGYLLFITLEPVPDAHDIFIRFAKVFEQTYTRFLDLQKAEAQTREAQIEAGLERARAQSMMMQHSEELNKTSQVFHEQLYLLGIESEFSYLWLPDEVKKEHLFWATWQEGTDGFKNKQVIYPLDKSEPAIAECYVAWESGMPVHVNPVPATGVEAYFNTWSELLEGVDKFKPELYPDGLYYVDAYMKYGCFGIMVRKQLSEDEQQVLHRFSREFERAYTRFLDLKKAESQAREAQIEAALEKVRSRSLAMHTADELQDVVRVVAERLQELGVVVDPQGVVICTYPPNSMDVIHWTYSPDENRSVPFFMPYFKNAIWDEAWESKNSGEEYFSKTFPARVKNTFLKTIFTREDSDYKRLPKEYKDWLLASKKYTLSFAWAENSALLIPNNDGIVPTDEQKHILIRFTKVFEQAYTRFLDLKKAEKQAREAQIEAALERVRSKTMAMHNSNDVGVTVITLFDEVLKLGLDKSIRCGIGILEGNEGMETWSATSNPDGDVDLKMGMLDMTIHPMLIGLKKAWENGENSYSYEYSKNDLIKYYSALNNEPEYPIHIELDTLPEKEFHNSFFFSAGILFAFTSNSISDEAAKVLNRFAGVFGQTYRRYLDLQKAEAQARESQIELSLERIRAQVTAMKESSELLDIVVTMRTEFVSLGHEAHYFWHMRYLPDKYKKAMTSGDGARIGMVMTLPRHIHGDIKLLADWEKSDEPTVIFAMDVETAVEYVNKMISLGDFQQVDPNAPTLDDIRHIGGLTFVMARTTHGEIGYSLPGVVTDVPDEDLSTLIRFTGVFDLAYRRFEDLKSSESRNREAQIELALERVRARTMAMQKSNELAQTAAHLFSQLNELGIKPYRCNISIVDKELKNCRIWSTTNSGNVIPTGSALPLDEYPVLQQMYDGWKTQKPNHIIKLIGTERLEWTRYISKYLPFEEYKKENINEDELIREAAFFTNLYFKQGFFTIHSKEELTEDQLKIIQRFASVFEQTYTRFLDLENSEKQNKIIQAENERKTEELEEARQLQLAMLPKELPKISNLEIAVYMKTATEVGGDYYDFHVDSKNNLTAIIGDATGHGMKAGTMVTITKSLFNSLASSKDILKTFKRISEVIKNMKFRQLSMCLQMIKINGSELSISSAAMPPAFIYRSSEDCVEEILLSGMPLGAMLNYQYKVERKKIKVGDVIFLLSDGLPELHNDKKHMYGYEKIKTELKKVGRKSPQKIVEHFEQSASDWLNGAEQDDDVTFVVIKVK